jgi:glycosyltransferase involved in cell wall biosynthesis
MYLLAPVLGKMLGAQFGLRSDNIVLNEDRGSLKWLAKRTILGYFFRFYATGHPTGTLAAEYLETLGFAPEQLFRFPYAVDVDWLASLATQARAERAQRRAELGIADGDFVVLGIMKFTPREDPMTLLRAYADVIVSDKSVHLVLVGDGELRDNIDEFVRLQRLDRVHLPGYAPYSALPGYFAISDIFVHTAVRGSWEVSVHESLACGVPVIVADTVGSAEDLVKPAKTGCIFHAGDSRELATCVGRFIADPKLLAACTAHAGVLMQEWSYSSAATPFFDAIKYVSASR